MHNLVTGNRGEGYTKGSEGAFVRGEQSYIFLTLQDPMLVHKLQLLCNLHSPDQGAENRLRGDLALPVRVIVLGR